MKKNFIIVVADDDLDDQEIIEQSLKDCKLEVKIIAVFDGVKLMDYLLKRHIYRNNRDTPDLVLLDLNMPLMDGFDVLREIRNYDALQSIPVYVITTSSSKEDRIRAMQLGATGFYHKGASSKDIRRIVNEICKECFESSELDEAAE